MRKIIWIYSINTRGGLIVNSSGSGMAWKRSKKFQDTLTSELLPENDLTFITYDITEDELPAADLIIYQQMDSPFISDEIKKKGLEISFTDIYTGNIENIKHEINSFIEKQKGY